MRVLGGGNAGFLDRGGKQGGDGRRREQQNRGGGFIDRFRGVVGNGYGVFDLRIGLRGFLDRLRRGGGGTGGIEDFAVERVRGCGRELFQS